MGSLAIIYYSRSGNTRKMAELIAQGAKKANDVIVSVLEVSDITPEKALDYDGIVIGSPTYYGHMAWQIKKFLDDSVKFHGKFSGKVGAAFTSSANIGGGNETTVLGILQAMLIHGMILKGDHKGDHYGPVSIGSPDERAKEQCINMGYEVAQLVKLLEN